MTATPLTTFIGWNLVPIGFLNSGDIVVRFNYGTMFKPNWKAAIVARAGGAPVEVPGAFGRAIVGQVWVGLKWDENGAVVAEGAYGPGETGAGLVPEPPVVPLPSGLTSPRTSRVVGDVILGNAYNGAVLGSNSVGFAYNPVSGDLHLALPDGFTAFAAATLSPDGRYVSGIGYRAKPGTAAVETRGLIVDLTSGDHRDIGEMLGVAGGSNAGIAVFDGSNAFLAMIPNPDRTATLALVTGWE